MRLKTVELSLSTYENYLKEYCTYSSDTVIKASMKISYHLAVFSCGRKN